MKNIILILFVALVSCKEDTPPLGVLVSTHIEISVKDTKGVDLLNPNSSNHILEDEIKVYHLVNGSVIEAFDPNKDAPRDFMLFEHSNEYRIRVFGNDSGTEELSISYVEWNELDTDTLKYQITRQNNGAYVAISKVLFNDLEVWDELSGNDERYFEIVK